MRPQSVLDFPRNGHNSFDRVRLQPSRVPQRITITCAHGRRVDPPRSRGETTARKTPKIPPRRRLWRARLFCVGVCVRLASERRTRRFANLCLFRFVFHNSTDRSAIARKRHIHAVNARTRFRDFQYDTQTRRVPEILERRLFAERAPSQ